MATAAKLKIGLILDTSLDPTDGVPQYVVHIGEWLRSQGHEVHYLVGETKRQDLANIHSLSRNINVRFNGNRTNIPLPASRRKLKRFMHEHEFDVLHVQTPHHPLLAQPLIMAASPRTAVVGTFHVLPYGWMSRFGNRLLGIWLRPSLRRINKMLAVSPPARDFCRQTFKVGADILPNVVDYQLYNQSKPLSKFQDGKLNILFLGRLVERKGCLALLQAAAKLLHDKTVPDFRVIICGRGPLEPKLREFAAHSGLKDRVTFEGYVTEADKPHYYASADLAVFPAKSGESFGIVLLEATANGRAVVLAGNNPGYHSVMGEQPELLFNPLDAEELADKLKYYLENSHARQEMAEWGAAYSRQFDVQTVGQRLLKVYSKALLKQRRQ